MAQRWRDFFSKQFHAFARQMVRHIAELELNQEIPHLGFLNQALNAPSDGSRAAHDNRLRGVELFPVFYIAQKFAARFVALEIFSPGRGGGLWPTGTIRELAPFAPQVTLETIFQKVPNALLAFLPRLLIRLGDVSRHQNAKAERMILVSVFFQHGREFLLRFVGFAAVAAR